MLILLAVSIIKAACLFVLLLLASHDLRRRQLPNRWVAAYALLFLPYIWLAGFTPGQLGEHLLVGGAAFLVLFVFFVAGVTAGGDVKLGTAVLLWAGPALALPVVAVIAWTGGVVGVLGWLADRRSGRRLVAACRPLHRVWHALSARRGVPYGVALAAGGLYVLWRQARWLGAP